jgi:hypothetical protein
MRNTPVIGVMVICLCVGQYAFADYNPPWKTFTSDGTIKTGDSWWGVDIYDTAPNHTTVDMTGGFIVDDGIRVHNAATFNFSGGRPGGILARDYSTVNLTDGVSAASVINHATVNISGNASVVMATSGGSGIFNVYGGNISNGVLVYATGVVNVYGGIIDYLSGSDSSVFNLRGGLITSYLAAGSSAAINVFGYDLAKTNAGGTYGYGQITGFWQDGSQFTLDLNYSGTYSAVNLIPEPTTFLLLGVGTFLLRKPKFRTRKSS